MKPAQLLFQYQRLVDRERVQSFARRVAELQASNQALRLLCTGPWPPYSFAQR